MESHSIKSCPTPLREESPNSTDQSSHLHASMLLLRVTPSKGQSEQHGLGKATSNPVWQRKCPKCSWWDIKFYQGLGINRFSQNRPLVISDSWYFLIWKFPYYKRKCLASTPWKDLRFLVPRPAVSFLALFLKKNLKLIWFEMWAYCFQSPTTI